MLLIMQVLEVAGQLGLKRNSMGGGGEQSRKKLTNLADCTNFYMDNWNASYCCINYDLITN